MLTYRLASLVGHAVGTNVERVKILQLQMVAHNHT